MVLLQKFACCHLDELFFCLPFRASFNWYDDLMHKIQNDESSNKKTHAFFDLLLVFLEIIFNLHPAACQPRTYVSYCDLQSPVKF